jgi:hypothetical protein
MAAPSNVSWDHAGHLHTNALHWEGFPHLLWESLSLFHYTEPPQYDGVEYREEGVPRCRVRITIPQHPFRSQWHPIEVDVVEFNRDCCSGGYQYILKPASNGGCRVSHWSFPCYRLQ